MRACVYGESRESQRWVVRVAIRKLKKQNCADVALMFCMLSVVVTKKASKKNGQKKKESYAVVSSDADG